MADSGILKVGVATWEDANKLEKDNGLQVRGVFDVRRLINKHPLHESLIASGLSGISCFSNQFLISSGPLIKFSTIM